MIRNITIYIKDEFRPPPPPPIMEHKIHEQAIAHDQFPTKPIYDRYNTDGPAPSKPALKPPPAPHCRPHRESHNRPLLEARARGLLSEWEPDWLKCRTADPGSSRTETSIEAYRKAPEEKPHSESKRMLVQSNRL